jgi:hypothetical protein
MTQLLVEQDSSITRLEVEGMPLPAEERRKLRLMMALEVEFQAAVGMEVILGTLAMGNVPQTRQPAEALSR